MTQTLILYWDKRRLSGLTADGDAARPRVLQTFDQPWSESETSLLTPAQQAERLRSCLPAGSSPERVIVCLSREDVILRQVDVPDVPDEDLAALVGFQAATKSSQPLDQLLLDFLPLPKSPGHEGRSVLAVTAPKAMVGKIQAVLQAAGLEAASVTFSSAGLAEFVVQTEQQLGEDSRQAVLAVFRESSRIELVILANRHVVYGHSARLPTTSPDALGGMLSEVSRALVAAGQLQRGLSIHHGWLCGGGDDAADVARRLAERLGAPVQTLDRTGVRWVECPQDRWAEHPSATAAMLGLSVAPAARLTLPFDFLHPRKPPKKVDVRKLRLAAGSAAALLLAVIVMGSLEWTKSGLQGQIDALLSKESDLNFKIDSNKNVLAKAELIDDWQAGNLDQLAYLSSLEELMGGTSRLYLQQFDFNAGQGELRARLQAFGNAKEREDVTQFFDRLVDTKEYRIHARGLGAISRDDDYFNRFELNADLVRKPKEVKISP